MCPYLIDHNICGVRDRFEKKYLLREDILLSPFCSHVNREGENFMCGDTESLDKVCDRMKRWDKIHNVTDNEKDS